MRETEASGEFDSALIRFSDGSSITKKLGKTGILRSEAGPGRLLQRGGLTFRRAPTFATIPPHV